ncbi:hypothetical protein BIV60_25615 [Bacillus sp. MUM 116]|uniref:PepSY domain-containing protein n=1 Tax=Bacillus sp. MUM 116 TaxID=1678002 RepID=UPI0008F5A30C|nr:PepSY domain-containing protein [Bacillus sp. MUM 116]OIK08658.1 hypothetical protein BIV60_25615 [Bacillus sp. MUM 116]
MIGIKFLASVLSLGLIGGEAIGANAIQSIVSINKDKTAPVEEQDSKEQAQLQKEASITPAQATKTVLDQYQGGKVKHVELEGEDGFAEYGVEVTSKDGKRFDVTIDAKTGKILKEENENDEKGKLDPNN